MHRFCKNRYFFTISVPIAGFPPEPMIGSAAELPQYLDVTWEGLTILKHRKLLIPEAIDKFETTNLFFHMVQGRTSAYL